MDDLRSSQKVPNKEVIGYIQSSVDKTSFWMNNFQILIIFGPISITLN
jgi:hypothetical protein